ncbi:hypothetical protein [Bergeriella denitrificans]|uniref:Uncharacterized protein n=1 Tax=Bergeriella denitrificans TaxID=494 RepID=A0A378UGU1_BERDE|nr:hypothetical protein [Bergeriella denitrificans]STZ76350.1 Uncharacterised protein [Bergeriella denitrificans]
MQTHHFTLYRGDSRALTIELRDGNGQPLNLSGVAVEMRVKPTYGDGFSPALSVNGHTVNVTFSSCHTEHARWSSAKYDLQLTSGGAVRTVLRGTITLLQDITPAAHAMHVCAEIQSGDAVGVEVREGVVKNLYQLAKESGFDGTVADFIASLKGKSAFELAVEQGFDGTLNEWLTALSAAPEEEAEDAPDFAAKFLALVD